MHKLLITDLDDTLYDWSGFFVPAFYAMAEEIAGITGIAMDQLLHEYREVHQSLGTVEFPYATLRLPSIRACFTGMETAQMKEAAKLLEFEHAAFLRDRIEKLKKGLK